MKLVLADPTLLKDSISVISDLVNEARFKITRDGLELIAMLTGKSEFLILNFLKNLSGIKKCMFLLFMNGQALQLRLMR